jgi:hypothetical protein
VAGVRQGKAKNLTMSERKVEMEYATKWRTPSNKDPLESRRFATKELAEDYAFAFMREFDDIWIEDDSGKVVVRRDELERRRTANAQQAERGRIAK